MERPLRLIADDGMRDPRRNLAVEEAIARSHTAVPLLRLWRNNRCVVLGRFQVAAAEVDLAAVHELRVPVYRRLSAGGAVYHDPGNLNVSLIAPREHPLVAGRGPGEMLYAAVLDPLASAARSLGVPARPDRRGLFIDGRKLGGVAAWLGGGNVLVHATLLIDASLDTLRRVLDGPGDAGNPRWERTKSEPAPVTSLVGELDGTDAPGWRPSPGSHPLTTEVDRVVVDAFATIAGGPTDRPTAGDRLHPVELAAAADLYRSRYATPAWHLSGRLN